MEKCPICSKLETLVYFIYSLPSVDYDKGELTMREHFGMCRKCHEEMAVSINKKIQRLKGVA